VSRRAYSFLKDAEKTQAMDIFEDFPGHKLEQKKDRTDLILRDIYERYYTRCRNLKSLYDDPMHYRVDHNPGDKWIGKCF
jgi:hypothetical protein